MMEKMRFSAKAFIKTWFESPTCWIREIDGKEVVMQVKVGDTILYSKYAGSEFKVDGKELTIIRQSDILAIVE